MCVWHNKNCGQIHIPLSGIPENTARKIPRNRCPPSSRSKTHKVMQISKMYRNRFIWRSSWRSICDLLHTFFQKVSQSAPLAPQVWPGGSKSYQNGAHGCQNTNPGSSKRRPRVSKCSPRARKYIPNCTFFQKASQSAQGPRRPGPELQEAITIKPAGVKIRQQW